MMSPILGEPFSTLNGFAGSNSICLPRLLQQVINFLNMGYHMMGISGILTVWLVGHTDNGCMFNLDWTCLFF